MTSSKAKSRRKTTPQSMPLSALEDEDWTTKSMRLIEENFKRNGGVNKRATPEDRQRENEDWKRTQNETAVHEADPATAVLRWRELWEQREPGGDNEEFEDLCDQFHYYSDVLGEFCSPDDLEDQTTEGQLFRVWKGLYEAGLTEACIIIARDDDLFTEKENILSSIMSIIIGVISWGGQNLPMDYNEWTGIPDVLVLTRAICANAWAHKELLLSEGRRYGDQNSLRMSVAEILEELALIPESNERITRKPMNIPEEERNRLRLDVRAAKIETRRLAFYCWMNGRPPTDLNRAFFGRDDYEIPPGLSDRLLREVVETFELEQGADDESIVVAQAAFIQQEIVDTYGVSMFLERVNLSLRESPLGRLMGGLLRSFGELVQFPKLRSSLMESGTFLAVREAADREALTGRSDYDHWLVLRQVLWIYRTTFMSGSPAEIAYLVRECNIIELIARYVRLYAILGHEKVTREEPINSEAIKPLKTVNIYASFASVVNMRSGKNTLRKTMRHSLRQEWYSTLHDLRAEKRNAQHWQGAHRPEIEALERAWIALGEGVQLDEEAERRDFEREAKKVAMVCSWRACVHHHGKPSVPLQTCKGCGQAKYCSRDCQKLDWKEGRHKLRCGNRLADK